MGKKKSKGNGEGTLYISSKTGLYVGQYVLNGKRYSVYQKKSEKVGEFKKRFNDILNSINSGTYIEKNNETVYSIIEKHIQQKFNDKITRGRSYKRDIDTLTCMNNCCSNFINKPIQKVTFADIQYSKEYMKDYSQSVINMMWRLLKKAFAIASSSATSRIFLSVV